ncbi:MAG: Smr/MutS family protein [Gammaproteobacteria bacterium]|jgi:DNA-nicking Smr family endonuclease
MAKSGKPSTDDIELFRRSVGPVRKIHHDKTMPSGKPLSSRPRRQAPAYEALLTDSFSDGFDSGEVTSDEALFFARPGLQQRQLQRLKRGQLTIGAELDMHGMTATMARSAVVNFIALCREQHIRCVRIIHGKGYGSGDSAPVLKNRINSWLRQHHDVLAFSSAQIRDGGSGALYVLLRSGR